MASDYAIALHYDYFPLLVKLFPQYFALQEFIAQSDTHMNCISIAMEFGNVDILKLLIFLQGREEYQLLKQVFTEYNEWLQNQTVCSCKDLIKWAPIDEEGKKLCEIIFKLYISNKYEVSEDKSLSINELGEFTNFREELESAMLADEKRHPYQQADWLSYKLNHTSESKKDSADTTAQENLLVNASDCTNDSSNKNQSNKDKVSDLEKSAKSKDDAKNNANIGEDLVTSVGVSQLQNTPSLPNKNQLLNSVEHASTDIVKQDNIEENLNDSRQKQRVLPRSPQILKIKQKLKIFIKDYIKNDQQIKQYEYKQESPKFDELAAVQRQFDTEEEQTMQNRQKQQREQQQIKEEQKQKTTKTENFQQNDKQNLQNKEKFNENGQQIVKRQNIVGIQMKSENGKQKSGAEGKKNEVGAARGKRDMMVM